MKHRMNKNKKLLLISDTCFKTMCSNFTRQTLTKQGTYIELIQLEHLNQLYELFELNRDYLRLYINGIDSLQTREDVFQRWGALRDNSLPLGIWLNETQMVGRCRLTRNNQSNCADIGYWLSESYQGQGLMTAAAVACIQFAFQQWNVERIEIHCGENNLKSRAIPERLGFVNEGISSIHPLVEVNGQMVQSITYSKCNSIQK
jgi:ribosomal-protein-serine acetyltransferase